jgi:acylphosphatase
MSCCHYLVSGRVQGVGFRSFAQKRAREQKLVGWVRNLRDGRVELLAQGEEANLAILAKQLQEGPPGAQVRGVSAKPQTLYLKAMLFEILSDGEAPWTSPE